MTVDAITSVTPAQQTANAGSAAATSGKTLDYDAFLQLLVAELKNQDPTKPIDSAQYIAQLAGFSNVEQSIKLNSKLDTLIASQSIGQASSIIGKTVTSADGSVSGIVNSIRILDTGTVAELTNGQQVDLVTGIKLET